ncbi:MAG TPA: band 7 protein [Cyanobacteria bacterium UBA8553]|nr:band 7 protein [Cyanobacteria bacterium UBA8553]
MKPESSLIIARQLTIVLVLITIISTSFSIVNAGERGVLMTFGEVQEKILGEGIHLIIPIVNTVQKLSVRVQKQEILSEAASKDLQKVSTNIALNWHIIPEETNAIFQQIGDENQVIQRIINPAIEEVLKSLMAKYTAEEIITKREEVKARIDDSLTQRLAGYHIAVDDTSLVQAEFSKVFSAAVEAKQVSQQEAKQAGYLALKAAQEAEAKVNLAKGEAEAHRLLRENLTPEILKKQAIEKWDGKLPLIIGKDTKEFFELDLKKIVKADKKGIETLSKDGGS